MSTEREHGVVILASTSAAYAGESALRQAGLGVKIVPVPRSLSTDCCLGLQVTWGERERVLELLQNAGIPFVELLPWTP